MLPEYSSLDPGLNSRHRVSTPRRRPLTPHVTQLTHTNTHRDRMELPDTVLEELFRSYIREDGGLGKITISLIRLLCS